MSDQDETRRIEIHDTSPDVAEFAGRLEAGARIRHYELIRELGQGGMGQVFLARDLKLGRRVAMKFLHSRDPEISQRFLVEARATASCTHENIVVIHEVSDHDGLPYMVLEYVEGETLAAHMRGRQLGAVRAAEIGVAIGRALGRAHAAGIIHRDLKPENVIIARSGGIKVLDFGIAKLFHEPEERPQFALASTVDLEEIYSTLSTEGKLVGTRPFMSPEQWGVGGETDHRSDFYALGVILYRMVTRRHPIGSPVTVQRLLAAARDRNPLPSVATVAPELPAAFVRIVDRCLRKNKAERYASAEDLIAELEAVLPGRSAAELAEGETPYPGLAPFQESDAARFFGRAPEVAQATAWIRSHPLMGIVGPSGAGKSSFVRAGLIPALRRSGEPWEVLALRPGRRPLASLGEILGRKATPVSGESVTEVMRREPGYLGSILRARARVEEKHILLFVDQLEELYTLVHDPDERRAFTACLLGVGDDLSAPLRVVVSVRSDFLDRVAEHPEFMDELQRGLVFLPPPKLIGLRDALVRPAEMAGYRFESEPMIAEILEPLAETPGALPLLQFAAAKLWEARDRPSRRLTRAAYEAMGGIEGALATHADGVIEALSPTARRLAQALFLRLVTPEGTRSVVEVAELESLAVRPVEVRKLIHHLVEARLLVVQARSGADHGAVEIVHESLIRSWRTLKRWMEESEGEAAFVKEVAAVARQWEARGRPPGLLWRGEAMEEARRFQARYRGELAPAERRYLHAVVALGTRAARLRRVLLAGAMIFLFALAAAAAAGFVMIREAEQSARAERDIAASEAERARAAERQVKAQLQVIEEKERERSVAAAQAVKANTQVEMSKAELQAALARTQSALELARNATTAERRAKAEVEALLGKERQRVKRLEQELGRVMTDLK